MKRSEAQHIKEERAVFKRGGASPRLMAEERAEYAKKGQKFADGGVTEGPNRNIGDDVRARALASVAGRATDTDAAETTVERTTERMADTPDRVADAEPTSYKSFREAFAANRKAGNETFEYKGKKYTTEMKRTEAAPAASASKPSRSLSQRLEAEYAELDRARRAMPASANAESRAAFDKAYNDKKSAYEAAARAERDGSSVMKQKLANGGVVRRSVAKSHGRMC